MAIYPWQEKLDERLSNLVEEIGNQVLEGFRGQITEEIELYVKTKLREKGFYPMEQGIGSLETDRENMNEEHPDYFDLPYGPEVTAMATNIGSESLYYTYCFTREMDLDCGAIMGIDGKNRCLLLKGENIAAVVSLVDEAEFGEEAMELNLKDMNWLGEKVRTHEQVIEKVMAFGPVVPLKFCTIFRSPERITSLADQNAESLRGVLEELAGTQEWGVKMYCDKEELAEKLMQEKNLGALDLSQGAGYLMRKRLEKQCSEETEGLVDNCAQQLFQSLQEVSTRWVINAPHAKEITGRKEEMVMNVAFLLPEERVGDLCKTIEDYEARFTTNGIIIEGTGPWPPYHFVEFSPGEDNE